MHITEIETTQADISTPPAIGEYWPGQGGHYICTLPAIQHLPARHLIAAAQEFEDITYGPYTEVPGAGSRIDGAANTAALLASGEAHPAAQKASGHTADGHSDFFLPAQLDLFMASLYAPQLFNKDDWYWTSTQLSRDYAIVQGFEYGLSFWFSKGNEYRVRAVRVIHL